MRGTRSAYSVGPSYSLANRPLRAGGALPLPKCGNGPLRAFAPPSLPGKQPAAFVGTDLLEVRGSQRPVTACAARGRGAAAPNSLIHGTKLKKPNNHAGYSPIPIH